jgi:serine/threonine-protein kinase
MNRLVLCALASAAAVIVASGPAWADPPRPASDAVTAQNLFYEARALMRENKFGLACPKLEESLRLDYGIGTEFNLADCNEKVGKLATAWSRFINVAVAARARHQEQREKVARERAKALEARLPKLTIEIDAATPNLEVKRNGVVVDPGSWGTAIPVDPGFHRITASAPGRRSWETTMTIAEGKPARVVVPALPTVSVEAPSVPRNSERAEPVALPAPFPEPIVERVGTQRTIGWIVSGVGLAGLGVGAGFGLDSLQKRESAKDHCERDVCDGRGVSLRDQAIASGDIATVSTIAGGAALLGGLILVVTAPRSTVRKEAPPSSSFHAVPHIAANGAGLTLQGVLP